MNTQITWNYEIGQNIEATHNRKGIIIGKTIMDTGRLHSQSAAYEVKDGRRKYVVDEGDIKNA